MVFIGALLGAPLVGSSGKVVFSGNSSGSYLQSLIAQKNVDGLVDQTFGTTGNILLSDAYQINALALQSDGKIVVTGFYLTNSGFTRYIYVARLLANGSFDPIFGTGGEVIITQSITGSTFAIASAVALQQDGKIVVAGLAKDTNSPFSTHFTAIRFLSHGELDPDFGVTGEYTESRFPGSVYITELIAGGPGNNDFNEEANGIVIQEDGSLILAGHSTDTSGHLRFALARFLPNGALDPSFGKTVGGTTSLFPGTCYLPTISGGTLDMINALALQADNKIVVAGLTQDTVVITAPNPPTHFAAARFLTDGTLDSFFGATAQGTISQVPGTVYISSTIGGGTINYGIDSENESANALQIQQDGKIVLAGYTEDNTPYEVSQSMHFAAARFLTNGTLDPSFGVTGANTFSQIPGTLYIYPVITGSIQPWVYYDVLNNEAATSLILQNDGRLLLTGFSMPLTGTCYAAVRLMPDGSLDSSFGVTSSQTISAFPGTFFLYPYLGNLNQDQSFAAGVQPNGNIVMAGSTFYTSGHGNTFEGSVVRFFNPQNFSSYKASYTSVGAGLNC